MRVLRTLTLGALGYGAYRAWKRSHDTRTIRGRVG